MKKIGAIVSLKNLALATTALMLMFTLTAFIGGVAKANNWTGRAERHGYFDNKAGGSDSPYPDSRGPVIDNNDYATQSIPNSVADSGSQTNRKQELFDYLQNKYNNPGKYGHANWDKTGVSFIVNTMIGNDPKDGVRNISAAMWTKLHDQLFASGVTLSVKNVSASSYGNVDTYFQYPNNDVAWYSDSTESGRAIVLSAGGKDVYVLLYKCANPLGNLAGLPLPPQWTLSTSTTATKTNSTTTPALGANEVIPGDTITWNGVVKNNGPDATDAAVTTNFTKSNGWTGNVNSRTIPSGLGKNATSPDKFVYKALDSDLGKTLCISTTAQPHAWNDSNPISSPTVCYNVVYRYEIHPGVTVGNTSVEAGSDAAISVTSTVNNGGPTTSRPTNWQLIQCRFNGAAPGGLTAEQISPQAGTQYFGGAPACGVVRNGTNTFGANTTTTVDTRTAPTNNLPAGTRLCYGLSANPASATDTRYRHSPLVCIVVRKSPKVQALGGDVKAASVKTHTSANIGGKFYGSWAEYGIFGVNGIVGMASAGSLAGGSAVNSDAAQRALTFANTGLPLGNFYSTAPAPDAYFNAYKALAKPGPILTGAIAPKTQAIIYVGGNLTINQNITYPGTYASAGDVPRVIYVVEGNIIINRDVTQIDAWLIAKGTLFTCSDFTNPTVQRLTTKTCDKQLRFNGPVNVGNTVLGRTYGSDKTAGSPDDPAEIFNLAPSNYLSNYTASVSESNIQTVYEKELPPRW